MTSSPELARLFAAELARFVSDVVICPGSRNSALSLAVLARNDLRVHTRIDERSASFLALGMARVQGRHVAIITTSGTAVANCAPAMVEAAYSHTPLVMISADRPARLHGTGANQTIVQDGIFNVAPTVNISEAAHLEQLDQAFTAHAVHLNVQCDTPLVEDSLLEAPSQADQPQRGSNQSLLKDHGEVAIDLRKPTLVIAGDEAWEVEGLEDVPTIAEPSAPAPFHPVHPLAAGVFSKQQVSAEGYVVNTKPEQIIVVGHPTLHREVMALLSDPAIDLYVLSRSNTITDPAQRAKAVGSRVKASGAPTKEWLNIAQAAAELGAEAVRDTLAEDHGLSGLHVAAAVADTLGTGDTLFLGSSNPVRDAAFVGLPFAGVDTFAARGAAGIDGSVSQAIGIALALQQAHPTELRPPRTVALMGDVTFLHDIGGLLTGEQPRPENLTIVVANDDGCGIFETLEVGAPQYRERFERAFGTPHHADLEALCQGYEVEYQQVDSLQDLIVALIDSTEYGGFRVIEAKTTRATRRDIHASLQARVSM